MIQRKILPIIDTFLKKTPIHEKIIPLRSCTLRDSNFSYLCSKSRVIRNSPDKIKHNKTKTTASHRLLTIPMLYYYLIYHSNKRKNTTKTSQEEKHEKRNRS